jgi:hypothetical protein
MCGTPGWERTNGPRYWPGWHMIQKVRVQDYGMSVQGWLTWRRYTVLVLLKCLVYPTKTSTTSNPRQPSLSTAVQIRYPSLPANQHVFHSNSALPAFNVDSPIQQAKMKRRLSKLYLLLLLLLLLTLASIFPSCSAPRTHASTPDGPTGNIPAAASITVFVSAVPTSRDPVVKIEMQPQVASVPVLWTPSRTDYRGTETGRARVLTVDEKQRKGTKTKGEE